MERIKQYYQNQHGKVVMGYDGFVDEVWNIVESQNEQGPVFFDKISDYANALLGRHSGGMSFGVVQKRRSHGGFVANTGKAIGRLGGELTLLGAFGTDEIDPAYKELLEWDIRSLGDPFYMTIYEFLDGKIFMGGSRGEKPQPKRTWDFFVKTMGMDALEKTFADANLVGFGYLGEVDLFVEIIEQLVNNYLAAGKCHRIFFDFANIKGRSKDELLGLFEKLAPINKKIPISLSLNEHEGKILYGFYGRDFAWKDPLPTTEADASHVQKQSGLDEIIVHTPFFALGASDSEGAALVKQRNVEKTLITTGAGDNFNGGYMSACLQKGGLTLQERLLVANAVTAAYVQSGNSPDWAALKAELEKQI